VAINQSKINDLFSRRRLGRFSDAEFEKVEQIRESLKAAAETLIENTPADSDQSTGIRRLREALLWAAQAVRAGAPAEEE
jgi:hypothetical protein